MPSKLIFLIFFFAKIKSSELDEEWDTLTSWFLQFGNLNSDIGLGIGPVGRGLFAKADLPSDTTILQIPIHNVISADVALQKWVLNENFCFKRNENKKI